MEARSQGINHAAMAGTCLAVHEEARYRDGNSILQACLLRHAAVLLSLAILRRGSKISTKWHGSEICKHFQRNQ